MSLQIETINVNARSREEAIEKLKQMIASGEVKLPPGAEIVTIGCERADSDLVAAAGAHAEKSMRELYKAAYKLFSEASSMEGVMAAGVGLMEVLMHDDDGPRRSAMMRALHEMLCCIAIAHRDAPADDTFAAFKRRLLFIAHERFDADMEQIRKNTEAVTAKAQKDAAS